MIIKSSHPDAEIDLVTSSREKLRGKRTGPTDSGVNQGGVFIDRFFNYSMRFSLIKRFFCRQIIQPNYS